MATMAPPTLRPVQKVAVPAATPMELTTEQSLLGAILAGGMAAFDAAADLLKVADFGSPDHQRIYQAILDCTRESSVLDALTVANYLRSLQVNGAPVLSYLVKLQDNAPAPATVSHYARLVQEQGLDRQMAVELEQAKAILQGPGSTNERLQAIQEMIASVQPPRMQNATRGNDEAVYAAMEAISNRAERGHGLLGMPTGFDELDLATLGLCAGDLVIIAGRPSMGKTTFAQNICMFAATRHNCPGQIITIEMPDEQLAMRQLSEYSGVPLQRLRAGDLHPGDWECLKSAAKVLAAADVVVTDVSSVTANEICSLVRRENAKRKLRWVVIDYLQLIATTGGEQNRASAVGDISRALKMLARELGLTVILLSQLNRSVELRQNKRPIMSDLRESGAIEQDADVILFIYRDEVYNEDTPDRGIAEVIIGKQRNGPIGTVRLLFEGDCVRLKNGAPSPMQAVSRDPFIPQHARGTARWYQEQ